MRRHLSWVPALVLAVLSAGCSERSAPTSPAVIYTQSDQFLQLWVHSYEEDPANPEIQVFRPADYREFAPSWFRLRYEFHADGTCAWLILHPADAHYMETAAWETDPKNPNVVSIINPVGTEVVRFRILGLEPDLMRIETMKHGVPRCNWLYGKVDVHFQAEARFSEVDAYTQSLGLDHEYFSRGNVQARTNVLSGDPEELKARLEAEGIVDDIIHVVQTFPEAKTFLEKIAELEVVSITKNRALVRYEVPVGSEEEWIEKFLMEPVVERAGKAGAFCP